MKNPSELNVGDRVVLTRERAGWAQEFTATYLGHDTRGVTVRVDSPMSTEAFIPWVDKETWISDPVTMQAFDPAVDDHLEGVAPDRE